MASLCPFPLIHLRRPVRPKIMPTTQLGMSASTHYEGFGHSRRAGGLNMQEQRASHSKESIHLQIEFARHSYDNQQGIIRQMDVKAGVFITLMVFLVTEAIPLAKDVSGKLQ